MGASFNGKAYEVIYKHKDWERTADMYEEIFAAKLYKTPYVQEAARTALTRLSKMLNAYYSNNRQAPNLDEQAVQGAAAAQQAAAEIAGEPMEPIAEVAGEPVEEPIAEAAGEPVEDAAQAANVQFADGGNDRVEITDTLIEALLPRGDSSEGAGQVGSYSDRYRNASEEVRQAARQIDEKNLDAVINGDGNLRERMTMLYNGMFINGGGNKKQIAEGYSLKNMMAYITEDERESIPELEGVRTDLLQEMRNRKRGKDVFDTYSLARDLKNASDRQEGRGNWLTRFFQGIRRGFAVTAARRFIRKKRSAEERQEYRLGENYYNRRGLELSGRESINGLKGTELQWQEGRAWFKMKKRVNAQGMLQTAGPSGTALRMLGAYKLMGASLKELLYFRLALIAWMVSSKDHSLYEIMTGSQNAGVTGSEDLSEPATMYMTVDPIPVESLRQEFAPERQFPHEHIYKVMLNELTDKREENARKKGIEGWDRRMYALYGFDLSSYRDKSYRSRFLSGNAMNAEAQDLALNIYTTGAYLVMNRGQKYGNRIARRALRDYNEGGSTEPLYEYAFRGELENTELRKSIFNMIRISSRMSQDALEERGQAEETAYGGEGDETKSVYRGQKLTGDLRAGENAEITVGSLTSSSKDIGQANVFYKNSLAKEGPGNVVMVEYKMHGKGAVDISGVSSEIEEREVLIPANTKFRIVKPLRKAAITDQGIAWNEPEEADREEKKEGELAYGYVICLEEVEGPGSVKRQEAGEIAGIRRQLREDYNLRMRMLRIEQEQQEREKREELRRQQEVQKQQRQGEQQEQENQQGLEDLPTLEEKLIYQKLVDLKHGGKKK